MFGTDDNTRKQRFPSLLPADLTTPGLLMPATGFFSKCGRKHLLNEDRFMSMTIAEALGSDANRMVTFADMLSIQPEEIAVEEIRMIGVFDGHGGSGCVDFISKNIANRIAKAITTGEKDFAHMESALIDGFKSCEDEFVHVAAGETLDNSGCCALVALLYQNQVLVSWTGDCRAVLFDGKRAEQLSVDHRPSDADELKRIRDNGGIVFNNRLHGVLSPSRCFGDLDIRASTPNGVLIAEPSVTVRNNIDEQAIRNQTAFLILATDGVWDVCSNESACDIVAKALKSNGNNAEAAAKKLVEEAARFSLDDLTVAVCLWHVVPWDEYYGVRDTSSSSDEEHDKQ
jgi:serine/threonine protein phosphatase PrpC